MTTTNKPPTLKRKHVTLETKYEAILEVEKGDLNKTQVALVAPGHQQLPQASYLQPKEDPAPPAPSGLRSQQEGLDDQ